MHGMSAVEDCVFCRIVYERAPAYIVDENDDVIVFLSLENHPLIVTKRHVPDIFALDEALGPGLRGCVSGPGKRASRRAGCLPLPSPRVPLLARSARPPTL
jgi:hypothetical protein